MRKADPEFAQAYHMLEEILQELNQQPVNIDQYLKDLTKHAEQEYRDLIAEEQAKQAASETGDKKKKKKRKKG